MTGLRSFFLFSTISLVVPALADEEAAGGGEVSYYRDVRPIFVEQCQGCHQPAKALGKFVITSFAKLVEGSKSDDPIIVPGEPDASLLVSEITPIDGAASMPKKADPLTQVQIDLVRRWITQGAKDDTPESATRVISEDNPPVYENLPVITALDYSPDGELIAVAGYHEVLLHKADGSELVGRLIGLSDRIQSLKFSPDGKYLAVTGGVPSVMGEVQVWDVAKRKLRVSKVLTYDTIYGVSWSRDGKLVAFGCADNSVRAIDARTGEQVLYQGAHNDWVLDTTFSVDSSHLVSVGRDRSMKLIQVETQQFIDNITSITPGALKGGLMAVDCHPKEDNLVCAGADGVPKVYRMHRTKARKVGDDFNLIQRFEGMTGRVFCIKFDGEGTRFVAGSSFNSAGEVALYPLGGGDDFVAAAKAKNYVEERKLRGNPEKTDAKALWKLKLPSAVYAVAFSADQKTIAAAGFAGKVMFVDAETGSLRTEFIPVPEVKLKSASPERVTKKAAPPKKKVRRRRL